MRETELVKSIQKIARTIPQNKRLLEGIGDDCCIVRPNVDEDLVFTTDFVIENRHFTLRTHSSADVGYKALARSLSDLAAMGAEPVFCLVSLAVPEGLASKWIAGFYRGLATLARRFRISLAGGDLAKAERVTADVMCCGRVPRGKALRRSTARPGDFVYLTGDLGGSALGLREKTGAAWLRHKRPEPRIDAGILLRSIASAAMDLSDGISLDLLRLSTASQVRAVIDAPLPLAKGATEEDGLHGGEDYELLFTAKPDIKVPAMLAGVRTTRIGLMERGKPGVHYKGRPLPPHGFDHFL